MLRKTMRFCIKRRRRRIIIDGKLLKIIISNEYLFELFISSKNYINKIDTKRTYIVMRLQKS